MTTNTRATTGPRPTGITILAVLAGILGVILLLVGLLSLLGGAAFAGAGGGPLGAIFGVLGLVFLALGVLYFVLAYGFWGVRPWAWTLGLVLAVITVIFGVLSLLGGDIISALIQIGIGGAIIYYLWQPAIKAAFGRPV